jgi:hypothetical protein
MSTPTPIDPKRLKTFKTLAAWPDSSSSSSVPMMFLMAESFKLVMQVWHAAALQQKARRDTLPLHARLRVWHAARGLQLHSVLQFRHQQSTG